MPEMRRSFKTVKHSLSFYRRVAAFLRPLGGLFLRLKFRLKKTDLPALPESFIQISNHVTNFDFLTLTCLTKRQMFFVATEHIFSLGWLSRLLENFFAPIPRPKGGQAAGAVMDILRRVKDGGSVGLFAEGNCSWDGCTASFAPATGKMVRASGVSLVTCRIHGGYFAAPRWGKGLRRGKITGKVTGFWPAEMLKSRKELSVFASPMLICPASFSRTGPFFPS